MKVQNRWLLELPNIYTFNFQYEYTSAVMQTSISKGDLQELFKMIPSTVDLKEFLKVGEKQMQSTRYIMRGMITYYGRHYIAYFYSHKHDTWVQFNDEHLKSIGNFKEVIKRCVSGRQQPTTIFYEHEDVIINVISAGEEQKTVDMTKKKD